MKETQLQSLVQENPTCRVAAEPGTTAVEPVLQGLGAHVPQLLQSAHPRARAPKQEKTSRWETHSPQLELSPCGPQLEKKMHSNKDTAQPQNK